MKSKFSILLRPMNRDLTTPLMTLDIEADTLAEAVNSAMRSYAQHHRHIGIGALMIKVFPLSFPAGV